MFGRNGKPIRKSSATTLIAQGTEVLGDLQFQGNLVVEGAVRGNIFAYDEASSVQIMQSGHVEGDVRAPNIIVNGPVVGEVHSSSYLELAANAAIEGDVHYNIIEMVRGSQVNGSLIHSAETPVLEELKQHTGNGSTEPVVENKTVLDSTATVTLKDNATMVDVELSS